MGHEWPTRDEWNADVVEEVRQGGFRPSAWAVFVYSAFFLVPLILILKMPNSVTYLVVKMILAFVMVGTFSGAWRHQMPITLGPFLAYEGLALVIAWYFIGNFIGLLASAYFVFSFYAKLVQVGKLKRL